MSEEWGGSGDLRERTKAFALRVIALCEHLGQRDVAGTLGRQVLRSGTSVGAQYREAWRARSRAEFISKMQSAAQELEETIYWFELLIESRLINSSRLASLAQEADELLAIFTQSILTAKSRR